MKKIANLVFIFLLLSSCATNSRKIRKSFRDNVARGQYEQALKIINKEKLFKEKDSLLLTHMEKGMLYHKMGHFFLSNVELQKAKTIAKKLYTKIMSKKAITLLTNDNFDIYYGEKYEISQVHFYKALNHFLLYQTGEVKAFGKNKIRKLSRNEQQKELFSARAEILAWDSMLESLQNSRAGKTFFKNDLMAKVFGGFIHETIGTSNDDQTALQLYVDAKKLLFQNYNSYISFNSNYKKFNNDFDKLPLMTISKVKRNYVNPTVFQEELKDYLDYKILFLTKRIRPREYKKQVRVQSPRKSVLKKLKNKTMKRSNVGFIFHKGFVPEKVADKQYYGLGPSLNKNPASRLAGTILSVFVADTLGLLPPPRSYTPVGAHLGVAAASSVVDFASIQFELPKINKQSALHSFEVKVYNQKGIEVLSRKLPIINPMGDVAEQAVAEHSAALYTKIGARLATKHVVAIVASFATYKALKGNGSNAFLAKNAAIFQYVAASKGIQMSESADIRYWSTLPSSLRMTDFFLPKGTYTLKVQKRSGEAVITYEYGQIKILDETKKLLLNFKTNS